MPVDILKNIREGKYDNTVTPRPSMGCDKSDEKFRRFMEVEASLQNSFKRDLADWCDVEPDHPKLNKLFHLAFNRGSNLIYIAYEFRELSELIK